MDILLKTFWWATSLTYRGFQWLSGLKHICHGGFATSVYFPNSSHKPNRFNYFYLFGQRMHRWETYVSALHKSSTNEQRILNPHVFGLFYWFIFINNLSIDCEFSIFSFSIDVYLREDACVKIKNEKNILFQCNQTVNTRVGFKSKFRTLPCFFPQFLLSMGKNGKSKIII